MLVMESSSSQPSRELTGPVPRSRRLGFLLAWRGSPPFGSQTAPETKGARFSTFETHSNLLRLVQTNTKVSPSRFLRLPVFRLQSAARIISNNLQAKLRRFQLAPTSAAAPNEQTIGTNKYKWEPRFAEPRCKDINDIPLTNPSVKVGSQTSSSSLFFPDDSYTVTNNCPRTTSAIQETLGCASAAWALGLTC